MRFAITLYLLSAIGAGQSEVPAKSPVLVELFTSEGCSSCPPADALLARLEREQPVASALAIVLSEHVDYWDSLGWRDPFSSAAFTHRQENYANRLAKGNAYTPQMVIDGKTEFVGSEREKAVAAISAAANKQKTPIKLTSVSRDSKTWMLHVEIESAPVASELLIALVDPTTSSKVGSGENGGRNLTHVAVVRSLTSAGSLGPHGVIRKDLSLKITSPTQRAVAFLQAKGQGEILGAALLN